MRLNPATGHGPLDSAAPRNADVSEGDHNNSYFLHAGQVYVSSKPQTVVMILGSCVGVCLWDAVHSVGGATHFLLPSWDGRGAASPRYGSIAIEVLLQKLMESGARREHLAAKVFGGGCLFDSMRASEAKESLGQRNVEAAIAALAKSRVPVVLAETGRERGQRIVFNTATGESLVRNL
jgi:chemotaxis protein CheD